MAFKNANVINVFYKCKSQHWIKTEYEDNVLDYWKLQNGNSLVKLKKGDGLNGDNDVKTTSLSHLGAFLLTKSKRIMKKIP